MVTMLLVCCALSAAPLVLAGCSSRVVCARDARGRIEVTCLEGHLRRGEAVTVHTADDSTHRGAFVQLDLTGDSASVVIRQDRMRTGLPPLERSFLLASVDSIAEPGRTRVPQPIRLAAELALAVAVVRALIFGGFSLSGLN